MNTAIYIADLYSDNAHLMPWRIPLEIQRNWQGKNKPELWSGRDIPQSLPAESINDIPVYPVPRIAGNLKGLAERIREHNCDLLYFPVAFYRCYQNISEIEQRTGCRIVWYLPGGWYTVRQCFGAMKYMKFRIVLPYLVQAAFPKRMFFRALSRGGKRAFICFSKYSAEKASSLYPSDAVFTALPGMDRNRKKLGCVGQEKKPPYFLFFGPPSQIRGSQVLLRAFEELARINTDCRLHLCIRSDKNVDASELLNIVRNSPAASRIDVFERSLSPDDLQQEIDGCIAVVKPFLIVPSEIPLAVIESAQYGKPVLATGPDGTGDFARQFGLVSPHGDWRGLFLNMKKILEDQNLRSELGGNALKIASTHPSWKECTAVWELAGNYL